MKQKIRRIGCHSLLLAWLPLSLCSSPRDPYKTYTTLFCSILNVLKKDYVCEINPATLVQTGIDAMLQQLDPYTRCIQDAYPYHTRTKGTYAGIGIQLEQVQGITQINMIYPHTPAHTAGLCIGDRLIQVNQEDIQAQPLAYISALLQGEPASIVQLTVKRYGSQQPLSYTLIREPIPLTNVPYFGKITPATGYIHLAHCMVHAAQEVQTALQTLLKQGIQNLIIDLRGNPGGQVEEAIQVANLFIDPDVEILTLKNKNQTITYKTRHTAYATTLPIIVLIDQQSASAAEILAGVLQDYDRALLLGQKTYGKGFIQQIKPIAHRRQLKLTTAWYYLPSGRRVTLAAPTLPDSQEDNPSQRLFYTQHGRRVYENQGIQPDILAPSPPALIKRLHQAGLITHYATQFCAQVGPVDKDFTLSDEQYQDFVAWLQEHAYGDPITTQINHVEEQIQSRPYSQALHPHLAQLQATLQHQQQLDVERHKKALQAALRTAILARYAFQEDIHQALCCSDPWVQQACALLQNTPPIQ